MGLVVPVRDEAEALELFLERVTRVFEELGTARLEDLLFVDDGSRDGTLARLLELRETYPCLRVLELTRGFGKEAALTAGLKEVRGQLLVPMDVDLQDPPELLPEMVERWQSGYDVVLARRVDREEDTPLKRLSARWFYRVHNALSEPSIPENVGDFRLMDRQVVDALALLPETRRFMKGLFAWVGFRTTWVDYARPARALGQSKFDTWGLWNLALEGLTSFGTAPLRIWSYLGGGLALAAFLRGLYIALKVLLLGVEVPGYASIFVAVCFLGGLQLLGIGILGEYLGRTYLESKRRPVYLVREIHPASPER